MVYTFEERISEKRYRPNMFKKFFHSKSILLQWFLACIIILAIPFISILFNFTISKKVINKEVKSSSNIILNHMQSSIDRKLQNIQNMSHLLLLDPDFIKLSTSSDPDSFSHLSQICFERLKSYSYVYNDISILIYYPNHDYILASGAANNSASIYNSMNYASKKEMPPYDTWFSTLNSNFSKASYFFSDFYNYTNAGVSSIIFRCSNPFIHPTSSSYSILVSSAIDSIENDLSEITGKTLFICDENGTIINQFGSEINGLHTFPVSATDPLVNLEGNNYYYFSTKSQITDWYYILCTPQSLYLQAPILIRNVTILSSIIALLIAIALIAYTQYRNYKPVQELISVIPALHPEIKNEFQQIKLYHNEMQKLNLLMQNKLTNISKNIRELYFYSKLKGVNFHTHEDDIVNTLNLNFLDKSFVIASIYADNYSFQPDDIMKNWQLLQFAIGNVAEEILTCQLSYEHIQDEFFYVFFFILDQDQEIHWHETGISKFEKIFAFFREQFQIDLFITVSPVFKNFEQTANYYSDIIAAFEESYAQKHPGIHITPDSPRASFFFGNNFQEYSKEINLAVFQHDYNKAISIVQHYITYLQQHNCSNFIVRYNIYSLISSFLMDSSNYISQVTKDTVDSYLTSSLNIDSYEEYEAHLCRLLQYLCQQDDSSGDLPEKEKQLVKKIKNYVENYYSDFNLNIASIAEAVNLSPNYMSKIFKNTTGEGLLTYINNVRINHAKELLRSTSLTIDEIAQQVGFSNSRSFRRNFQKITEITATDYRNGAK